MSIYKTIAMAARNGRSFELFSADLIEIAKAAEAWQLGMPEEEYHYLHSSMEADDYRAKYDRKAYIEDPEVAATLVNRIVTHEDASPEYLLALGYVAIQASGWIVRKDASDLEEKNAFFHFMQPSIMTALIEHLPMIGRTSMAAILATSALRHGFPDLVSGDMVNKLSILLLSRDETLHKHGAFGVNLELGGSPHLDRWISSCSNYVQACVADNDYSVVDHLVPVLLKLHAAPKAQELYAQVVEDALNQFTLTQDDMQLANVYFFERNITKMMDNKSGMKVIENISDILEKRPPATRLLPATNTPK